MATAQRDGCRFWMALVVLGMALAAGLAAPAAAERRVALVIGNGAYTKAPKLANPTNDAAAIEALLKAAGFDKVVRADDLGVVQMRRALRDFSDEVRDADIAVVFYAGHGMEMNGVNYIVPIDAVLERDIDVADETVSLDRINAVLEPAKRLRLVILDACRDNPFVRSMRRTLAGRAIGRGLAPVEVAVTDTLFAYAAKAGSTAADGVAANSPYTSALVKHLTTPGLDVRLALGRVRDDVLRATSRRQEPFVYGSLGGAELPLVAKRRPPTPPLSTAAREWQDVKGSTNRAVLEAFRKRHERDPVYAALADDAIAKLAPSAPATPALPSPTKQAAVVQPAPPARCAGVEVGVAGRGKACLDPARPDNREFQDCFETKGKRVCGPTMVVVSKGRFLMGSTDAEIAALIKEYPKTDASWIRREAPEHEVTIGQPFAAARKHVTRGEFRAFVTATGHKMDGGCRAHDGKEWKLDAKRSWLSPGFDQDDTHPVVCVNWHEAQAYAAWLMKVTGQPYRLLTEAEAEFVARGVTTAARQPRYFFGNDPKDLCRYGNGADLTAAATFNWDKAWVAQCEDSFAATAPAGSSRFAANPFGVRDVHGNAWSWTQDCFADSYTNALADGSARTGGDCVSRVLRGGAWGSNPQSLRAAYRDGSQPGNRNNNLGFRLARTLNPTP